MKYKRDQYTNSDNLEEEDLDSGDGLDTTVVSEIIIIKRQILDSLFNAINSLSRLQRGSILDKENRIEEADFSRYCFEMFLKIRPLMNEYRMSKMKQGNKKPMKDMIKAIETSILEGSNISFVKWKEYFLLMQIIIRKLNVYGIGFIKDDPGDAWMSGFDD